MLVAKWLSESTVTYQSISPVNGGTTPHEKLRFDSSDPSWQPAWSWCWTLHGLQSWGWMASNLLSAFWPPSGERDSSSVRWDEREKKRDQKRFWIFISWQAFQTIKTIPVQNGWEGILPEDMGFPKLLLYTARGSYLQGGSTWLNVHRHSGWKSRTPQRMGGLIRRGVVGLGKCGKTSELENFFSWTTKPLDTVE